MKKMMIAVAVCAIAAVSQAAAVSWSTTTVKDINGNAIGAKAESAGWTAVCTLYTDAGITVFGTDTDKSAAMSKFSGEFSGTATGTDYWAKLVITDDKGNTVESELAKFTTDSGATYSVNFTTGAGFATSSAKINYAGDWVAAPEPTSGLLLLLGVAGLALKRKRA